MDLVSDALNLLRISNVILGAVILFYVLKRLPEAKAFGYKRMARYWGYLLLIWAAFEGSVESKLRDLPTGAKTAFTFMALLFVVYSELPSRKKAEVKDE